MNAVRQHILEILKEHSCATVAELADHLEMAPVSVRHHLDILQGDNLIRVERLARTGSVGRPQQVYALTPHANDYFPDNAAALASELLKQLKNRLPREEFNQALVSVAAEFTTAIDADDLSAAVDHERMDMIVDFLNERGYLARWEKDEQATVELVQESADSDPNSQTDDVYLLHKCNCPYSGIKSAENELCRMDKALIERLLGQPCERVRTIAQDAPCCTYRIGTPIQLPVELLDESIVLSSA